MLLFGVSVIINTAALVVLTAKILCYSYFKADIPWGRGARILVTFFIPDEFASLIILFERADSKWSAGCIWPPRICPLIKRPTPKINVPPNNNVSVSKA